MRQRSHRMRALADRGASVAAGISSLSGILVMGWILYEILRRGAAALNWSFFTKLPTPAGVAGGGVVNAIAGTLLITSLAAVVGIPLGLFAGVYLAEFGKNSHAAAALRFVSNLLMGTPSIIIGVFVYTLIVVPTRSFSAYAGAAALAFIMLPVMARTAEDMLNLVPNELRESALALGAPKWRVTLEIVFRAARTGLVTGALLAVARVSGETAPLLFTALNSPFWMHSLGEPTANLTVTIFNYSMSPYADWQRTAWAASFLIVAGVLVLNITARKLLQERKK